MSGYVILSPQCDFVYTECRHCGLGRVGWPSSPRPPPRGLAASLSIGQNRLTPSSRQLEPPSLGAIRQFMRCFPFPEQLAAGLAVADVLIDGVLAD